MTDTPQLGTSEEPTTAVAADLSDTIFDQVVGRFEDLPTLAPVAVEVLRLADAEDSSMKDITTTIETDPGLTLRLLKLANTAAYNRGGEVANVNRAAMLLGLRTLKLVTLGFSLVSNVSSDTIDATILWRRSVVGGVVARRFAWETIPASADDAFVAGMLSNLGKLALSEEAAYVDAFFRFGPWMRPANEVEVLGFTSDAVTVAILEKWGLPRPLIDAIGERGLEPGDESQNEMAAILRVCDHAAELLLTTDDPLANAAAFDSLSFTAAANLGMTIGEVESILEELRPELDEVSRMFDFDPVGQNAAADLVRDAHSQLVKISLETAGALAQAKDQNDALVELNERLEEAASTDPLTGLPNRRTFNAYLTNRIAGRLRTPRPTLLGLLMIDIDHFKQVNDRYGHGVGDEVLTEIGARLLNGTRRGELPARIGGEEFALVMPETTEEELPGAAERFRELIGTEPVDTSAGPLQITASIGASYSAGTSIDTEGDMLEVTDKALYEAKANGRNRVVIASVD
ncbi:MAG: diguanylate cyclase [Actinomycetota bacterium]